MLRAAAASCLVVLTLSACEKRAGNDTTSDETGSRTSADTLITKREMQDTAVITHDTSVSTDTTTKKGDRPVDTDTVKKN